MHFKNALKDGRKIYCYLVEGNYYDCGTLQEYKKILNLDLKNETKD